MIQASGFDCFEVIFYDPCVPMLCEQIGYIGRVCQLTKSVFIDDIVIPGPLKYARRYPRLIGGRIRPSAGYNEGALTYLQHKPSASKFGTMRSIS